MRLSSCLYFIQHLKMLALFTHNAMHDYNSVTQNLMVKHKNGNIYIQTIPMVKLCFIEVTDNFQ